MRIKKTIFFITSILFIFVGSYFYQCKPASGKYSIDHNLITQISSNVPNYTSIDKMPDNLKKAVISIEDRRFYKHHGFDIVSTARALFIDIKAGGFVQGGSTITQQLAKNLFLSNDKSFRRKIDELIYAVKLEKMYSKDQILEMYLNVIYYGSNTYGVENASKKYFNKDVSNLSLAECAMLAGIPQSPNANNPIKNLNKAKKRQEIVLNSMVENGFLNKSVKEVTMLKLDTLVY